MSTVPPAGTPVPDQTSRILTAARDYLIASRAIHTTHGSMDVHGHGGMAAQAITDHCAWQCNATGVRYVNEDGLLRRVVGPPPHALTLAEWHRAESELVVALREAGIIS
jgi:hypothetical protein